jgi:hypothetical protein
MKGGSVLDTEILYCTQAFDANTKSQVSFYFDVSFPHSFYTVICVVKP